MTGSLALFWPAVTAAFLASLVEAVEALTIVLAVATVRGWRSAGLGAIAGLGALALIALGRDMAPGPWVTAGLVAIALWFLAGGLLRRRGNEAS